MKMKLNALIAAVAALASVGAHAALTVATNPGNSSVMFVAVDAQGTNGTTGGASNSITIDLGYLMTDFLAQSGTQGLGANLVNAAGSLSSVGTTVVWDFKNNTTLVNGVAQSANYQWSAQMASFESAVSGIAGNSYTWGVIAADNFGGTTASATNPVVNQNYLATGTPTFTGLTSGNVSTAASRVNNFILSSNGTGTQLPGVVGANTATAGGAFLDSQLKGNFGGQTTAGWSYLTAVNSGAGFNWANQSAASKVYSIGGTYSNTGVADTPASFYFDAVNDTLTYTIAAVPEPGTYAMLMAGMVAVGFTIRRRAQR